MLNNQNTNQTQIIPDKNKPSKKISPHPQKEIPQELIDQIPSAPKV